MRRFGQPYKPSQRYKARPGVYVVLEEGGMLLLTEQQDEIEGPQLQLPGGGIDAGENPLQALHRECMEETGWRVTLTRKLGAYRQFTYMPEYKLWAEKVCHIYLGRPVQRIGAPTEPDHTTLWMPIEDAATRVYSPGDRAFVASLAAQLYTR